jgi:hypothetical protein
MYLVIIGEICVIFLLILFFTLYSTPYLYATPATTTTTTTMDRVLSTINTVTSDHISLSNTVEITTALFNTQSSNAKSAKEMTSDSTVSMKMDVTKGSSQSGVTLANSANNKSFATGERQLNNDVTLSKTVTDILFGINSDIEIKTLDNDLDITTDHISTGTIENDLSSTNSHVHTTSFNFISLVKREINLFPFTLKTSQTIDTLQATVTTVTDSNNTVEISESSEPRG